MSLSVRLCFPFISVAFLSCRLPISSPHFLALPCISPLLASISRKQTRFFQRFRKEDVQKHRVFQDFQQKEAGGPSQQKSRQGESSLRPLFCDTGSPKTTFSGTSSNCCAVRYALSSRKYPTRGTMLADSVTMAALLRNFTRPGSNCARHPSADFTEKPQTFDFWKYALTGGRALAELRAALKQSKIIVLGNYPER